MHKHLKRKLPAFVFAFIKSPMIIFDSQNLCTLAVLCGCGHDVFCRLFALFPPFRLPSEWKQQEVNSSVFALPFVKWQKKVQQTTCAMCIIPDLNTHETANQYQFDSTFLFLLNFLLDKKKRGKRNYILFEYES